MLKTFIKGGVHPPENKLSANQAIKTIAIPKLVTIPVSQHIGAPAAVVVQKNDLVKAGQLIAKSNGYVSANIHSSVSGKVLKIEPQMDSSGYNRLSVVIETAGDEWMEGINNGDGVISEINSTSEEIIQKVSDAGIVGLGGATFPTQVKLTVPKGMKAEILLINGVECEPYLTSDHRLMLEKPEEILIGVLLIMKALQVEKAIIGIENNKKDAIQLFKNLVSKYPGIHVEALKVKYPQGGEKQLIKAVLNREVPSGSLPVAVGTVVHNVGTAYAVYQAVQKNKPLIDRVVTVTGKSVKNPGNFLVRIGTSFREVIEAAGGFPENTGKIVSGGPMMGKAVNSIDIPVTKGISGILLIPENESRRGKIEPCIRCSKCLDACPMGLEPYLLMPLVEKLLYDRCEKEKVMDCIECGSCSYTCPSNKPLLDFIRLGKSQVGKIIRTRKV
jgi:Na+-translocating ferredoxin:NAD+ oxidoreductase subunit C